MNTKKIRHANSCVMPSNRVWRDSSALSLKNRLCIYVPLICISKKTRTNFDYLFSVPHLAELRGPKFKRQRHLAKRFVKEYPDAVFQSE